MSGVDAQCQDPDLSPLGRAQAHLPWQLHQRPRPGQRAAAASSSTRAALTASRAAARWRKERAKPGETGGSMRGDVGGSQWQRGMQSIPATVYCARTRGQRALAARVPVLVLAPVAKAALCYLQRNDETPDAFR